MTMPKLKAPKLSFEQAIGLLPKEFLPVERASYHRHKLRANTPKGVFAFSAQRNMIIIKYGGQVSFLQMTILKYPIG